MKKSGSRVAGNRNNKTAKTVQPDFSNHQSISDDNITKIIDDLQDLQLRHQNQAQHQREYQARFQAIFENAPVFIDAFDEHCHCILWNKACEKAFGWTAQELISHPDPLQLFYPDPQIKQQVCDTIINPDGVFRQWQPKTKSGDSIICMWANFKLPDNTLISIGYDITEQTKAQQKLVAHQEILQQLFDKLPVLLVMYDPKLWQFIPNKYAQDVLGWSADEAKNDLAQKIYPDKEYLQNVCHTMTSPQSGWKEWLVTAKDGSQIPIDWFYIPLTDQTFIAVGIDLRQRKQYEKQLQDMFAEKQLLANIIHQSSQPFAIAYPDGRIGITNPAFQALTGYTPQELKNITWKETLTPPQWRDLEAQKLRQLDKTGLPVTYEKQYLRKDGSLVSVELLVHLSKDQAGNPQYYFGFINDITERKITEQNLKKEQYYLSKAQEIGSIGTWEMDLITNKIVWTDETHRIFAIPLGTQITYEIFLNSLHPADRQLVESTWNDALNGKPFDIEHRIIADGNIKWVKAKAEVQFDQNGKPIRAIGFAQDITYRKKAEKQREYFHNRLKSKNEELEHFFSVLRHDLGNPLLSVQAFSIELDRTTKLISDLLKDQNLDPKINEKLLPILNIEIPSSVNYIQTAVKQMSAILKGLKQVSDAGRVPVNIEKLDMNKLIKDTVDLMQHQFKDAAITLTLDRLPDCMGDANQIRQVFNNLLSNAVKYRDTNKKPQIRICGKVEQDQSIYSIEDNGIGLSPDQQQKIFDPFYRAHTSEFAEGEGLGLTIVAKIIDRHDGRIWVDSQQGQGSKFFVALPHA